MDITFQQGLNASQQQMSSKIGGISRANMAISIPQKADGITRTEVTALSHLCPGWEVKGTQF